MEIPGPNNLSKERRQCLLGIFHATPVIRLVEKERNKDK